jgi:hypothetical protein
VQHKIDRPSHRYRGSAIKSLAQCVARAPRMARNLLPVDLGLG